MTVDSRSPGLPRSARSGSLRNGGAGGLLPHLSAIDLPGSAEAGAQDPGAAPGLSSCGTWTWVNPSEAKKITS